MAVDAHELLRGSPEDLVNVGLSEDFAHYTFAWHTAVSVDEMNVLVVPSYLQTDPMMHALNEEYLSVAGLNVDGEEENSQGIAVAFALRRYRRELVKSGAGPELRAFIGAGVLRRVVENLPPEEAMEQLDRIAEPIKADLRGDPLRHRVIVVEEGLLPWSPTSVVYGGKEGQEEAGAYKEVFEGQSSWSTNAETVDRRRRIVAAMFEKALHPAESLALIGTML